MAPRASRSVTRWLLPAVAVLSLVVAALAVVAWLFAPGQAASLTIVEMSGDVQLSGPERQVTGATQGMQVGTDDRLKTGDDATVVLTAGNDTEIRLAAATDLRVTAVTDDAISVELDGGRVRADVRGGRRSVRVASGDRAVRTTDGAVAVAVEDGLFAAEVLRGSATTEGLEGVSQLVAGGRVTALDDGTTTLGAIPDDLLLQVAWPEARRTRDREVVVRGQTAPGASVTLDGRSRVVVRADGEGWFEATVALKEGAWPVIVEAVDPFGARVTDQVVLERDTTPPIIRGGAETQP